MEILIVKMLIPFRVVDIEIIEMIIERCGQLHTGCCNNPDRGSQINYPEQHIANGRKNNDTKQIL